MQDVARRAAGGVKENVISSPIYMKMGPPPPKKKMSITPFRMQGEKRLVIDSVEGL